LKSDADGWVILSREKRNHVGEGMKRVPQPSHLKAVSRLLDKKFFHTVGKLYRHPESPVDTFHTVSNKEIAVW
jgi:hypothetical protein